MEKHKSCAKGGSPFSAQRAFCCMGMGKGHQAAKKPGLHSGLISAKFHFRCNSAEICWSLQNNPKQNKIIKIKQKQNKKTQTTKTLRRKATAVSWADLPLWSKIPQEEVLVYSSSPKTIAQNLSPLLRKGGSPRPGKFGLPAGASQKEGILGMHFLAAWEPNPPRRAAIRRAKPKLFPTEIWTRSELPLPFWPTVGFHSAYAPWQLSLSSAALRVGARQSWVWGTALRTSGRAPQAVRSWRRR